MAGIALFDGATGTGISSTFTLPDPSNPFKHHVWTAIGTFSNSGTTMSLEISIDGTNWAIARDPTNLANWTGALSAPGSFVFYPILRAPFARGNITAFGSGTVSLVLY